ncbi:MAG: ankyrin repeat domain-containing protein [Gammaproteobacteria bacterium]|nr:ankyrin repeat domain-containing protein [Gammaproteobacteria bacterium]
MIPIVLLRHVACHITDQDRCLLMSVCRALVQAKQHVHYRYVSFPASNPTYFYHFPDAALLTYLRNPWVCLDNVYKVFLWACRTNHYHHVRLVLKLDVLDPTLYDLGVGPVRLACRNGCATVLTDLLASTLVCQVTNDCLFAACRRGHVNVVRILLKVESINPWAQMNAALRCATHHQHVDVIKLLLEDGRCDPFNRGMAGYAGVFSFMPASAYTIARMNQLTTVMEWFDRFELQKSVVS